MQTRKKHELASYQSMDRTGEQVWSSALGLGYLVQWKIIDRSCKSFLLFMELWTTTTTTATRKQLEIYLTDGFDNTVLFVNFFINTQTTRYRFKWTFILSQINSQFQFTITKTNIYQVINITIANYKKGPLVSSSQKASPNSPFICSCNPVSGLRKGPKWLILITQGDQAPLNNWHQHGEMSPPLFNHFTFFTDPQRPPNRASCRDNQL